MTARRRRGLIQGAAIIAGVLILNTAFPQPWHVTAASLVIAVALGLGLGIGSSVTDDAIRRWRK